MVIFSGGKSVAINSPRHLTIRHARKLVRAARKIEAKRLRIAADDGDDRDDEPRLPGEEKLNSYWAPRLVAGPRHSINVTQTINTDNRKDKELTLTAGQDFLVDAPQFSLPEGSVHSVYPPSGYSDDHRILPHVVLTDPHLPWERYGSSKPNSDAAATSAAAKSDKPPRNRVPWLVVFSFSQDELRLPPEDLDGPNNIFRNTSAGVAKPVKQSSTMAVNMSIEDLWVVAPDKSHDVTTPIATKLGYPDTMKKQRGDFIFVKPELFTSLFSPFDKDGTRQVPPNPNTLPYQYLAHVRKINSSGMALAGVEDTAVFSIVVGSRSGQLDNVMPTTMTVHLVSIEGVEEMTFPIHTRYVALCSLYSWNYTVMPPNTVNVPDAFEHLGSTLDQLRAPEEVIKPLRVSQDGVARRIASRLDDGYTLVKHQTQTGEPTIAIFRGALTPTFVHPLDNLNKCSNSGVDLQILDKEIGIMDITYSVAWQVGRTMALGDESFTAALGRLRATIGKESIQAAKLRTIKDIDETSIRTRKEVLGDLPGVVESLAAIHIGRGLPPRPPSFGDSSSSPPLEPLSSFAPGGPKKRWHRRRLARTEIPNLSFTAPLIEEKYPEEALAVARSLAQSSDGAIYDETNDPVSTDWMIVLSWLVDRMFLAGMPAHCLITDPSHLGHESLRFFHIDPNWIDALIDGALSLGNHMGTDLDRVAIKQTLNDYINNVNLKTGLKTQIPTCGFYLRSDLVTMFPDLRVEVLPEASADIESLPPGTPLLRHEIVTDGVMMGLIDRVPGSPQFGRLAFTQPPHQQRFAVARGLDATMVKVDIRRQYTVDKKIRETDKNRWDALKEYVYHPNGDQSTDNIFIWDSKPGTGLNDLRILRLPRVAKLQCETLQELMPKYKDGDKEKPYFNDNMATSALLAMQLNDPIYNLTIDLKGTRAAMAGPDTSSEKPNGPRTLKQLAPVLVNKPRNIDNDKSGGNGKLPHSTSWDDADNATEWKFERHKNYAATESFTSVHLAPHIRTLASAPARGLDSVLQIKRDDLGGVASPPKYNIQITSNVKGGTSFILLERPNLAQDLIFSIQVSQDPSNQYKLVELDLTIKLGRPASLPSDPVYLMLRYDGPGSHMLTNLRFNVLPVSTVVQGIQCLQLRVLPRAARGSIDMKWVNELGFLLGLAKINDIPTISSQLKVQSRAWYCRDPNNPRIDLKAKYTRSPQD
ncbi:hypothetical protein DL767_000736 [Monosporascus sp. MG133]|nr:hypothetical protein DL767_000736 [Monosporascus sp. MG133]